MTYVIAINIRNNHFLLLMQLMIELKTIMVMINQYTGIDNYIASNSILRG